MHHVEGIDRSQFTLFSLEEAVGQDSLAQVIDLFVDSLDMTGLGFVRPL